jgi:hypothetical protein
LPLFEEVDDGQPAVSGCGESQERREPSTASAARRENIEPRGIGRVRGPSQEPRSDQGLERLRDLQEVIPDVLGQTLADEESPRMTMEKKCLMGGTPTLRNENRLP